MDPTNLPMLLLPSPQQVRVPLYLQAGAPNVPVCPGQSWLMPIDLGSLLIASPFASRSHSYNDDYQGHPNSRSPDLFLQTFPILQHLLILSFQCLLMRIFMHIFLLLKNKPFLSVPPLPGSNVGGSPQFISGAGERTHVHPSNLSVHVLMCSSQRA